MLAGLRLDGFVGRDHQQHQINAANSGQHVADKTLVAGNVDKSKPDQFARGAGEFEMGETNVDGDAAALLFFQAVGVDAGQSLDQRGLAMVDVAGGAYDD